MLLIRKSLAATVLINRSLSLTATRLIDVPSSKPLTDERQAELDESRKKMLWRIKPEDRKGAWYTNFKLFMQDDDEKAKEVVMTKLQKPMNLRPSAIKKYWKKIYEKRERYMQQHIPERHNILGNDLAAAHFIVFRKGKVKFQDQHQWTMMDENEEYDLPSRYQHGMFVEHIDCEGMRIYYEGLDNIRRLHELLTLSFKNVKSFDDWCLDRVSGSEFDKLEYLDLSGTNISHRGLQALYRVPSLKKLILEDPHRNTEWQLTLAMLQDVLPNLEIVETKTISQSVVT